MPARDDDQTAGLLGEKATALEAQPCIPSGHDPSTRLFHACIPSRYTLFAKANAQSSSPSAYTPQCSPSAKQGQPRCAPHRRQAEQLEVYRFGSLSDRKTLGIGENSIRERGAV